MPCVTGSMNGDIEDKTDRVGRLSKAAYLMVKGSIGEDLVKKEEFIEALQYAGIFELLFINCFLRYLLY